MIATGRHRRAAGGYAEGVMTLLWLIIWFLAGHAALTLHPVNAWAATLILAVGLDLASTRKGAWHGKK
jgi:hypothetical protein